MQKTISVREFSPPAWKYLAIFSIAVAIIFGGIYWMTSNTFWTGIFQLIAFAGFAGAVMALLRLREKPKLLRMQITHDHLVIQYLQDNKELKEELFERNTIKTITPVEASPKWDFISGAEAFKYIISFTDTDTELSMLTFSSRDVLVSRESAARIDDFLGSHDLKSE